MARETKLRDLSRVKEGFPKPRTRSSLMFYLSLSPKAYFEGLVPSPPPLLKGSWKPSQKIVLLFLCKRSYADECIDISSANLTSIGKYKFDRLYWNRKNGAKCITFWFWCSKKKMFGLEILSYVGHSIQTYVNFLFLKKFETIFLTGVHNWTQWLVSTRYSKS